MMRSMFSGVSGLRAHQTRMDVIGNNVANVNTVAFKSGRVTFSEIFSQTLRGAGAPDATTGRGGTNPMQIGLGLAVNAVDTLMNRGSLQRTDNPTDLSIEGDGFFIVRGGNADTYKFTRAGNFGIDKVGNLVTGSGLNVYGWQQLETGKTDSFDTEQPIEAINLYSDDYRYKRIISAKASENVVLSGNLDASKGVTADPDAAGAYVFTVPMTVYDKLGNDYKVNVQFYKTASEVDGSTWNWRIPAGDGYAADEGATDGQPLVFNAKGQLDPQIAPITIEFTPDDGDGLEDTGVGTGPFEVKFDFNQITTFAADSSVKPTKIDGYTMGNLVTFNIGSDGIITGIYSNGQQQALGQVSMAVFENPAGLQKVGDNLYMPSTNSGNYEKAVKPGADGAGTLNPGTLEMSNVDLSKEFTEMIITQRGFQANSRIITTSDELLQELVNLKR